jgi:hypothetical protein
MSRRRNFNVFSFFTHLSRCSGVVINGSLAKASQVALTAEFESNCHVGQRRMSQVEIAGETGYEAKSS